MSVELEPAELGFKRPFTHEVAQVLRLHNPNSDPVAFKVKTTAPKQYCVRPNSGRIEGGREVEVQVLLQAMKEDPPLDTRCRDKFLVQSVSVPADKEVGTVAQIWQNIEQTAKSSIQEKKIRVNFLPADSSTSGAASTAAAATNGVNHEDSPPAYSSPSQSVAAVTPQKSSAAPSGPISTPSDRPSDAKTRGDVVSEAHNPATSASSSSISNHQSTLGAAAASVGSVIPTSQADLQKQLEAANAKIKQLQEQASEGLRQRRVGSDNSGDSKSSVTSSLRNAPAPGGVPVQIVAALCLLCFLIAYLFF